MFILIISLLLSLGSCKYGTWANDSVTPCSHNLTIVEQYNILENKHNCSDVKNANDGYACNNTCLGTWQTDPDIWEDGYYSNLYCCQCEDSTCEGYSYNDSSCLEQVGTKDFGATWTCQDPTCAGTMLLNDYNKWICVDSTCPGTITQVNKKWFCLDTKCDGYMVRNSSEVWTCYDESCSGTMLADDFGKWSCVDSSCTGFMFNSPNAGWTCIDNTCGGKMIINDEGDWICAALNISNGEKSSTAGEDSYLYSGLNVHCDGGEMKQVDGAWHCITPSSLSSLEIFLIAVIIVIALVGGFFARKAHIRMKQLERGVSLEEAFIGESVARA